MIWFWLITGLVTMFVVHEAAHIVAGKYLGWGFVGMGANWKLVGVRMTTSDPVVATSAWMVAIAGPAANIVLGDVLWLMDSPIARALAGANFLVACINMLPIPGADGAVILKGLRDELA